MININRQELRRLHPIIVYLEQDDMFKIKVMTLAVLVTLSSHAFSQTTPQKLVNMADTSASQTFFPTPGKADPEASVTTQAVQIHSTYAYSLARPITGKGVVIADLDTGIDVNHAEFKESGKLLKGYNAITGGTDVTDVQGHGTHTAGLMVASRDGKGMFGIAYDSAIIPIKVLNDNGTGSTVYLDKGLTYAIGKAFIANMSLGATSAYSPTAVQAAVKGGMLLVAAAGNAGAATVDWPARFAKESWANNQIIAVGSVDSHNIISTFSNRAGDAAAWYLVAPGENVVSTYKGNSYAYMSGTSMATPLVSGAAALIKQMWPLLRADQVANILFVTATDLGAPGIDPIYGRGLLNVQAALSPVGNLTTKTYNGTTVKVINTAVKTTPATNGLWALATAGAFKTIGYDDFNRNFDVNMGATVSATSTLSTNDLFSDMSRHIEVADKVLGNGARFVGVFDKGMPNNPIEQFNDAPYHDKLAAFSFSFKAGNSEFSTGMGGFASQFFGAGGLSLTNGVALGSVAALSNPYFGLVQNAMHFGIATPLSQATTVKVGMLTSSMANTLAGQYGALAGTPTAQSNVIELSHRFANSALAVSMSNTVENGSFLGAQSSGLLSLGTAPSSTKALQVAGAYSLSKNLALSGQVALGQTSGQVVSNSLIGSVSASRTNSFSVALVGSDAINHGDRFSLSVAQPMRTYSGSMSVDTATAFSDTGLESRATRSYSLVPAGRELRTEMSYFTPLSRSTAVALSAAIRQDADNIAGANLQKVIGLRYTAVF